MSGSIALWHQWIFNIRNAVLHTYSLPEVQTSHSVHMLGSGNMKMPGKKCPISCPCQLPVPTAALQGCLQTSLAWGELLGIHTPSSARGQDWPLSFLPSLRVTPTGFYGFASEMFHFQMRLCPRSFQPGLLPKPTRSLNFTVLEFPSPWGTRTAQISVQFSHPVVSKSLRPHEPQHARPPCPSPTPGVHPNPCTLSRWCHPTISSSVVPFSSCPQSFPASGSFQMSQLFASNGQSIRVSNLKAALISPACLKLQILSTQALCDPDQLFLFHIYPPSQHASYIPASADHRNWDQGCAMSLYLCLSPSVLGTCCSLCQNTLPSKWLIPLSPGPTGVSQSQEVRHPWLPYLKWYTMVLPPPHRPPVFLSPSPTPFIFFSGLLSLPLLGYKLKKAEIFAWYLHSCLAHDRHSDNICWITGSTLFPLLGKLYPGPKCYSLSMQLTHSSKILLSHPPALRQGLTPSPWHAHSTLSMGDHTQDTCRQGALLITMLEWQAVKGRPEHMVTLISHLLHGSSISCVFIYFLVCLPH